MNGSFVSLQSSPQFIPVSTVDLGLYNSLAQQCRLQQQEIASLRAEVSTLRSTAHAYASRNTELEGLASKLQLDLTASLSENRRLTTDLARQLARDAGLEKLVQMQENALNTLHRDQQVVGEELHARTLEREALADTLRRNRAALLLEKAEADRNAALVGSHREWVQRSEAAPASGAAAATTWPLALRRDALPPPTPTLSNMTPAVTVGPVEDFLSGRIRPPPPRVLSAPEIAVIAATVSAPQPAHPLVGPRVAS